ncbi:MAG: alpha/beta fold hydrolase [Litorilinea sp.]
MPTDSPPIVPTASLPSGTPPGSSSDPATSRPACLPVVLVPGFRDDMRKVAYLARRLTAAGFVPHAISPQPTDGSVPLETLAHQLDAAVTTDFAPATRIHLFGFSMGGLIARYYVQKLDGAARVEKLVTLATPNHGSWMAWLYPRLPACRQMRPGSAFLAALNRDLSPLAQANYTSIWARQDLTIVPASSARLPIGTMIPLHHPIHGWLLRDPRVVGAVVDQFVQAEQEREN